MKCQRPDREDGTISIVLPVYNESAVLRQLCEKVVEAIRQLQAY